MEHVSQVKSLKHSVMTKLKECTDFVLVIIHVIIIILPRTTVQAGIITIICHAPRVLLMLIAEVGVRQDSNLKGIDRAL